MATIELGELGSADVALGPEMSGGTRRMLLAALVAVACLLSLGGSARNRDALGEPLWSGAVSLVGYNLGPRSVYLAEPNGRVVLARDIHTGDVRWRLEIDSLPVMSSDVGGGVAAVQSRIPSPGNQGTNTVMLVREATGEVLGTTFGEVIGPVNTEHQLLMLRQSELANDTCPEFGLPCQDVSVVDTADGSEGHRLSLAGGVGFTASIVDGWVDSYATYQPDGLVRIYDAGTGSLVESLTRPAGPGGYVMLTPDRLLTTERVGDTVRVDAYTRGPLTRLWSRTLPVTPFNPQDPSWWLAADDCGPAVCVRSDGQTALLDRQTGQPLFTYPGEIGGSVGGGVLIGFELDKSGVPSARDLQLIDPRSGAVRNTVRGATGVGWLAGGGQALLAQEGADRTAFVLVDPAGRTRVVGSVAGVGLNCQARDDVLACAAPSGLLRVWRLPMVTWAENR